MFGIRSTARERHLVKERAESRSPLRLTSITPFGGHRRQALEEPFERDVRSFNADWPICTEPRTTMALALLEPDSSAFIAETRPLPGPSYGASTREAPLYAASPAPLLLLTSAPATRIRSRSLGQSCCASSPPERPWRSSRMHVDRSRWGRIGPSIRAGERRSYAASGSALLELSGHERCQIRVDRAPG